MRRSILPPPSLPIIPVHRPVKTTFVYQIVLLVIGSFSLCAVGQVTAQEQTAKVDFFEAKIRPVLVKHCYPCHSSELGKSKGGLVLDSRSGWQVGGDSGAAIFPGKSGDSLLLDALKYESFEMPPKGKLPEQTIADFQQWIEHGAVDPRTTAAELPRETKVDIEKGRQFWSFQPLRTFSDDQSIDRFIQPETSVAEPDKLVRRLYLDLIGLPPSLQERESFLSLYHQQSPQVAVETVADRLLARREFGEKWARHWLDVARYADSNGGDFNLTFFESWRYRNYVIDAFNQDMPYDQFLREQIAGDLLPFDSAEQRNRQLIATGFLMVSAKMLTERDKPKMHLDIADEQLDTIGRAAMGLTLGCARCHDHKFDPISAADYYAMAGILHSTRTADRVLMNNVNVTGWTNTDLAVDDAAKEAMKKHRSDVDRVIQQIKKLEAVQQASPQGIVVDDTAAEKTGPWRKSNYRTNHVGQHYLANNGGDGPHTITWKASLPKPGKYDLRVSFCGGGSLAKTAAYTIRHADGETKLVIDQTVTPDIDGLWFRLGQFRFDQQQSTGNVVAEVFLTDENAGGFLLADAVQLVSVDELKAADKSEGESPGLQLKELRGQLTKLQSSQPKVPQAMAAMDAKGDRLGDLNIRIRGETKNLGPRVPRGFLQVASQPGAKPPAIPAGQSGRVELAAWLTRADHPLTARVMANRVWQQLFGRGIVATSDNFGARGALPSHPELLDYLAQEYVSEHWSTKSLIRKIVTSKTYQQAARVAVSKDPDNQRFKHQNRRPLVAESIRDSMLVIAGQLDAKPRESVVAHLGTYAIQTSGQRHASLAQTDELRQRSIYLPIVRGAVPPSLAVFDLPNPDLVAGVRSVTTVPAQALFMMNSSFAIEMAKSTSEQFSDPSLSVDQIIAQLFLRILSRQADQQELAMGRAYVAELTADGKTRTQAVASLIQVMFSSAEFRLVE
ncbi:MAG: hypothetical protein CBB71_23710 [Rhodopirellula sp. TMED11]|nr:MAG: hypothetical protein CBB71_23710 [Rhodopirellula sp. TMED11]